MDLNTQQAQHVQRALPREQFAPNRDELAKAFLASFKAADQAAEVAQADKKQKEEDQKKRQRIFTKADYQGYNELEDVLAEIDERLEKMLNIARQLDA
jgi:hypothetical protein